MIIRAEENQDSLLVKMSTPHRNGKILHEEVLRRKEVVYIRKILSNPIRNVT